MTKRTENETIIMTADEGKIFIRKTTGDNYGNEIWLGMNYHSDPPVMDSPEDFEEIDMPEEGQELSIH